MSRFFRLPVILAVLFPFSVGQASTVDFRDYLTIVGSSTLYPMITIAAESYARKEQKIAPTVESTGTGGGFKLFCNGEGSDAPDVNMASRPMKETEWRRCESNDVDEVRILKIGLDGIALANARKGQTFALRSMDLYLALAKEVPDPGGEPILIPNPYQSWREIDPSLPDVRIRVYGPPPTSGTRDLLVERLFQPACLEFELFQWMRSEDKSEFAKHCYAVREDRAYVPAGENDDRLVRRLADDPDALGILGFNQLERHQDSVKSVAINRIAPSLETIADGSYPLSRPLFIYAKQGGQQKGRGVNDFLEYLTRGQVTGVEGYLTEFGLVPLTAEERARWHGDGGPVGCLLSRCPCETSDDSTCCQGCR